MYIVTIIHIQTSEAIDSRTFEVGTFKEIGYWLDDKYYNDPRYKAEIRFAS